MGVSREAFGLLALARVSGADFSRVIQIGRHTLDDKVSASIEHFLIERGRGDIAAELAAAPRDGYCEPLLNIAFGAAVVQSVDASGYEHADIIHDMNAPMSVAEPYSLVIDFGTLEHVFNIPVAFDNVAKLAANGAYILHMLPSNNFVGHGFYQFSPELFFQIYAPERGYSGTRVFEAPGGSPDLWYEVRSPRELRRRVDITSRDQVHVMVITKKTADPTPLTQTPVQQSDYLEAWNRGTLSARREKRCSQFERAVRDVLNGARHARKVGRKDLRRARSDLTPRAMRELVPTF